MGGRRRGGCRILGDPMDYKRNRGGQSSPTKCIEGTIKKLTANKERGGG